MGKLNGCRVYGIAAWNLDLEGSEQHSLLTTRLNEPEITQVIAPALKMADGFQGVV